MAARFICHIQFSVRNTVAVSVNAQKYNRARACTHKWHNAFGHILPCVVYDGVHSASNIISHCHKFHARRWRIFSWCNNGGGGMKRILPLLVEFIHLSYLHIMLLFCVLLYVRHHLCLMWLLIEHFFALLPAAKLIFLSLYLLRALKWRAGASSILYK